MVLKEGNHEYILDLCIWKQKLNISGHHNNQHKIKHSLCQICNPRSTRPKADGHLGLDISHICLLYRIWVLSITWIYNWDYKIACWWFTYFSEGEIQKRACYYYYFWRYWCCRIRIWRRCFHIRIRIRLCR